MMDDNQRTCITCAHAVNASGKPYTNTSAVALCRAVVNRVNGLPENCDDLRSHDSKQCGFDGVLWIARAE